MQIADLEARGHQRFYSIMVLLYEESVLLTSYNTIVAHILQLVRQFQARATARLEREQAAMQQAAAVTNDRAAKMQTSSRHAANALSMAYGRDRAEMVAARYTGGGAFNNQHGMHDGAMAWHGMAWHGMAWQRNVAHRNCNY
jgi:hypothetical protein